MSEQPRRGHRAYNRFCPLSLALDQVGDRWTLHIVNQLMTGPKRYLELKAHLAGAGSSILSDRLRSLSAHRLVVRSADAAPGSEIRYQLTDRGRQLAPVVAALEIWGLDLLARSASGCEELEPEVFGQQWAIGEPGRLPDETYQWRIDGSDFQLSVRGNQLVRTRGRARKPAASLETTTDVFASILRGDKTLAAARDAGEVRLKGSRKAIARMFTAVGFSAALQGLWQEPAA